MTFTSNSKMSWLNPVSLVLKAKEHKGGQEDKIFGETFLYCNLTVTRLLVVWKSFHFFHMLGYQNGPSRGAVEEAGERLPKPCMAQK